MAFRSIRLHGFRNLADGEINLDAKHIYLIGDNGQGKTNFLESLYLLSFGSSFRTRVDKELICHGHQDMALHGVISSSEEPAGRISVTVGNQGKTIRLHDKVVIDRKDLLKRIPAIVFSHDDILFAGGPPERRRWFIDQTLSLHDPLYVDQLRRYRKLLKERNYLLKSRSLGMLDHFEEQLSFAGLALIERRFQLIEDFGEIFKPLFQQVSGLEQSVSLTYRPSWIDVSRVEEVMEILRSKREMDIAMGTTLSGPHRDRFLFVQKGRDFAKSASTGQRRLLSLALRVSQAMYYSTTTGRAPILLLDDVLLELDPNRRQLFRNRLPEAEQVIYTFLPGEETGRVGENSLTYQVIDGELHGQ